MADEYYGLPIRFSEVFKKQELPRVNIFESICFNIRLVLTTHFGENRFDYTYGCLVWEQDFENIFSDNQWAEQLAQSIRSTLSEHEKRLLNIRVRVSVGEEEFRTGKDATATFRVKKKIEAKVMGNFYKTNEEFSYTQVLYISPLSFEHAN